MPKFFIDIDLRSQGVEAAVRKVANTVQQELAELSRARGPRGDSLRGVALGARFVDIQTSGLAAVQELRRQGAPEQAVADLTRTINQQLAAFKNSFTDFNKAVGYAGQQVLQTGKQAERTAKGHAGLYFPPGSPEARDLARQGRMGPRSTTGDFDPEGAAQARIDATAQRAEVAKALNATNEYAEASARLAREENRLASRIARENALPDNVSAAGERLAEETRTRRLRDREFERLQTPEDVQGTAALNAAKQRRIRAEDRATLALTGAPSDVRLDAELAHAKRRRLRREQQIAESLVTPQDIAGEAQLRLARRRREAQEGVADIAALAGDLGGGVALRTAEAEVAVARKREAAFIEQSVQQQLAADQLYINATIQAKLARDRIAAAQRGAGVGVLRGAGEDDDSFRQRTLFAESLRSLQDRVAQQQRVLNNEAGIADLTLRERTLRREVNQKLQRQLIEQETAAGITGTRFQRVQQQLHARRGGEAQSVGEFATLGSFIGQRALTSIGYGVGGGAIYGVVNGIQEAIKAAEDLERILASVRAQFDAADDSAQFDTFRTAMLDIARDSGIAAAEVATVGFQLKGAYGDTTRAIEETRGAIRATVVTGIEQRELTDSLTAASLTYGLSIEDITDKAIGLEERFGVLARESLKVFGDMATVADQAGLNVDKLGALVGVVQQASGRGGAAIAEGFGRILPAVQGSAAEILSLYSQIPLLSGSLAEMQEGFREGRTGDVLLQMVDDYNQLTQSQQNYVLQLLGGRREAQLLIPLFQNSEKVMTELRRTQSDGGKTAERYANIQATLAQAMRRLGEEARQLGVTLGQLGVLDALKLLAGSFTVAVAAAQRFLSVLADINEGFGGIPARVFGMIFALKGLQLMLRGVAAAQAFLAKTTVAASAAQAASVPALIGQTAAATGAAGAAARGGRLAGVFGGFGFLTGATRLPQIPGPLGALGKGALGLGAFGTAAVTTAGLAAAAYTINEAIKQRNRLARSLGEQSRIIGEALDKKTLDELLEGRKSKAVAQSRRGLTGLAVRIASKYTDVPTPTDQYDKEILERTTSYFRDALESGLIKRTKENEAILESLEGGDEKSLTVEAGRLVETGGDSVERAIKLFNELSAEDQKLLEEIGKRRMKVEDTLRTGGAAEMLNAAQATEAFAAGEISYEKYITALEIAADNLMAANDGTPEAQQKALQAMRQARQAVSTRLAGETEFALQMSKFGGGGVEEQSEILRQALVPAGRDWRGRRRVSGLSAADEQKFADQYLSSRQEELQKQLDRAPNQAAAQKILDEGIGVSPGVRRIIQRLVRNRWGANSPAMKAILERIMPSEDQLKADIDRDLAEATARIESRFTRDPVALAQRAVTIANLEVEAAQGPLFTDTQRLEASRNAAEKVAALEDARREVLNSRIRLAQARTENPVEQARLEIRAAQSELAAARAAQDEAGINDALARVEEAQRGHRDALRDVADSRQEIAKARAGNNELTLAAIAIAEADEALRRAGNDEAAQNRAIAQRISADRAAADALFNISQSRLELAAVIADVTGDNVGASEKRLQMARDALARQTREDPNNEAVMNQLRGAVRQAEGSVRDTTLGEEQRQIDVALQLQEITIGQAVAQLQALLEVPGITQEQTDNLLLKIKSLKDSLGADFKFNIPTEIRLPTIYEVRRATSAESSGTGYNDNRVVQVQMNNYNATDYEGAINRFQELVGGAPRYGTTARKY